MRKGGSVACSHSGTCVPPNLQACTNPKLKKKVSQCTRVSSWLADWEAPGRQAGVLCLQHGEGSAEHPCPSRPALQCYVAAALDDADPNPQPTQQAVEGVRPLAAKEAREDGMGEGRGASSSGGGSSSSSMDGTEGKQGRRRQQQQPANRRQAAQDGSGSAGQGRKGKRALPAAAAEAQPLPKRRQQLAGRAPKEQQQDGGQAKQQQHLQAQPQQQQTQKRGGLAKFCGRRLPAAPVAYGAAAPVLPLPPIVAAAVGDEGEEWDWDAC